MRLLRSIRRVSWSARLYLIEALFFVMLARLALWLFSFARVTWLLDRAPEHEISGAQRETIRRRVQWAIAEACFCAPGVTVCFPRAIAAQAMLRRRGIGTTLYYGAATLPTRKLRAHVWLQDGTIGVVGHETAGEYHILLRFPQAGS